MSLTFSIGKQFLFHRGCPLMLKSILEAGLIAGRKRQPRRTTNCVLYSRRSPGEMRLKKNSKVTCRNQERHTTSFCGKRAQDAVYWIPLAKGQEKDKTFWQTKSNAIIAYKTVPLDCIDKVISRKGETTLYHRLSTPRLQEHSQKCMESEAAATATSG